MKRFSAYLAVLFLPCSAAIAQAPVSGSPSQTPSTSSATALPAVMSTEGQEVVQFQKIEDAWSNAVNQRDQYGLENVLSPLFVDVAANGDITTRNQQIVQVISSDDKTTWLMQKVITVRMLGDIAVANGTYTLHHKVGSAQVDEKGVFTHVFERHVGRWICVNAQRTIVPQGPVGRSRELATDKTAFHFPLISRR